MRGRILLISGLLIAAAIVFVAAALAGLELSSGDRILPGVRVLGLPLGGLTKDEAAARLSPRSAAILDQPVEITASTRQWTTTPRALGARLDPVELASAAYGVGHRGSPAARIREQLRTLQADTDVPTTTSADGGQLDLLLARMAVDIDHPAKEAVLDLAEDGTIAFETSQTGLALDRSSARAMVSSALTEGRPSVDLPTRTLQPTIATEKVADAHEHLVRMLHDASAIQVSAIDKTWTIQRPELLSMVSLSPASSTSPASVELNDEPLQALVQRAAKDIDQEPRDARFTLSNGQLNVLRQSVDGRAVNQSASVDLLKSRIEAGERTVALPVEVVRPAVASADAATWVSASSSTRARRPLPEPFQRRRTIFNWQRLV